MRSGIRHRTFALSLCLALGLAGCQTNGLGTSFDETGGEAASAGDRVSFAFYLPFYDQGAHMKSLVEKQEYANAAKLFAEQRPYFNADQGKHGPILSRLATELNARESPALKRALKRLQSVAWSAPVADWSDIRATLEDAHKSLDGYPSYELLEVPKYRNPVVDRVAEELERLEARIKDGAPEEFETFDHIGEQSFFDVYPVELSANSFMEANFPLIRAGVLDRSSSEIGWFAKTYPKTVWSETHLEEIAEAFFSAHMRELGARANPDLRTVLDAIRYAKASGFDLKTVPGLKIAFVDVTSRTLLKEGQIEFPAAITVDLPVETTRADLDDALTNATARSADYLIVFDVALAKVRRRVTDTRKLPSKVLVGHRTDNNPDYNLSQNELRQAQLDLQIAAMDSAAQASRYCEGLVCLGRAIGCGTR